MESLTRDNYVLRIYRRDMNDPEKVVGLVEIIQSGEKKPFTNFQELCEILKTVKIKDTHLRRNNDKINAT